jgi:hypothetical protein
MNLQKKIILGLIIIAIGILGLVFIRSTQQKNALENLTAIVNIGGGEAKLTGRFACIPNRPNATSTPVVGCILGLRGNNNLYYALDTRGASVISPTLSEDDIVTITGVLVPTEGVLNSDWDQFDLSGVIKVGNIAKATIEEVTSELQPQE